MDQTLRYDHYKVLGVPRDASMSQIKAAYRGRVKDWHPDRNSSQRAAIVFHAVQEAYETLNDPVLRIQYDERLRFYRQTGAMHGERRTYTAASSFRRWRRPADTGPDRPVQRFAFYGLHLTGLLFGIFLISGILIGCTWFQWPVYTLVFCAPGIAVIPDSLSGLRAK
jgi:curved DNA-binding protein CbpA